VKPLLDAMGTTIHHCGSPGTGTRTKPVAAIIRVRDYEEALAVANATPFGLSAGIVTTSLKHASHFKRHSASGLVMVNLPTAGLDYHVPFRGRKNRAMARANRARMRRPSTPS
jgi:aldehyde dehydrogenase (NAD+)